MQKLDYNKHNIANLSSELWQRRGLKRLFVYALAFILIQLLLEELYLFFPVENFAQLHTSITTGMVDNILPAFVIFWLCKNYVKISFLTVVSMIWLTIETVDAATRIMLQFMIYYADDPGFAYWFNTNYLIPLYWPYVILPMVWLVVIQKNFTMKPSDRYSPSKTYLYFRRPKSIMDLVISWFGSPASHVSIVHKGQRYFFKRNSDGYQKAMFDLCLMREGRMLEIQPPERFGLKLDMRLHSPYKFIKNNCVTILKGTGIPVGPLDFIPSVFLMRYL